jgi:ribosome biogenesis GTPase / thiamine phosphate phosphatase
MWRRGSHRAHHSATHLEEKVHSFRYTLADLGWDRAWAAGFESITVGPSRPGRIAVQHRGSYVVATERGDIWAHVSGRSLHLARDGSDLPVVGDWVALTGGNAGDSALISAILPRRSCLERKEAWEATKVQVIAANLDWIFITTALDGDLNLRRIERYLATAWSSGAQPVIVLTKADLHADPESVLLEVEQVAPGVPIHVTSCVSGLGIGELGAYATDGRTVALLGSSGVGKSSIINHLLGDDVQVTREVREDGKGRHTTARRELMITPQRGVLLDTPGMRELQLWSVDDGLTETFGDIATVAEACRFRDCSHESEPGCAVLAAVAAGTVDSSRVESWRKLQRELSHLERKRDKRAASEASKAWRARQRRQRRLEKHGLW